jgi:hypothetical protein
MHKNAMKCNETLTKWCKNKHGASKIIDTFETYQLSSTWFQDSGPNLGEAALAEFFILWQMLVDVQLSPELEDTLRWCWSGDGVY